MASANLLLAVILAITAGAVDVIGFLALGGLFSAHITGNLAIVAAHYTTGGFSQVGPLLAVPVFIVVLGLVVLLFEAPTGHSRSRRGLLILHAILLSSCLALGLVFGPFRNADTPIAVITGMLAVSAMAIQNAMVKLALVDTPSTAAMTSNTTQFAIDAVTLWKNRWGSGAPPKVRQRARITFACLSGFVVGCTAGAFLESHLGLRAMVLPVILATIAIPVGEKVSQETQPRHVRDRD